MISWIRCVGLIVMSWMRLVRSERLISDDEVGEVGVRSILQRE